MRLTRKSKYGVRALVELGFGRCPRASSEVAREARMPRAFVEQILGELRRAGLVESRRGAGGGFCPAVPPEEVSVLAVVEALDGTVRPPAMLSSGAPPAVSGVWEEARAALEGVLARHTIAELIADGHRAEVCAGVARRAVVGRRSCGNTEGFGGPAPLATEQGDGKEQQ